MFLLQGQGPVFLMAATLRPETMAGQTNCWVLPEGEYGAYRGLNGEIYVMTPRAARNLSFQDRTPEAEQAELLLKIQGTDLIGVPLKASPARLTLARSLGTYCALELSPECLVVFVNCRV